MRNYYNYYVVENVNGRIVKKYINDMKNELNMSVKKVRNILIKLGYKIEYDLRLV